MSAFICSDRHFSVIAAAIAEKAMDIQTLADKLKAINIDSVNYRYDEKTRKTKVKFDPATDVTFSNTDVMNLIRCWAYQSCEGNSIDFRIMSAYIDERCKQQSIVEGDSNIWAI